MNIIRENYSEENSYFTFYFIFNWPYYVLCEGQNYNLKKKELLFILIPNNTYIAESCFFFNKYLISFLLTFFIYFLNIDAIPCSFLIFLNHWLGSRT